MHPPAAASIPVNTLLDLLGQPSPTSTPDNGQTGFDALLQSPPNPPPNPPRDPAPASPSDRAPQPRPGDRPEGESADSSSTLTAPSGGDRPEDESSRQPRESSDDRRGVTPPAAEAQRDAASSDDKLATDESDLIVAQSLAGVTAIAPKAPSSNSPVSGNDGLPLTTTSKVDKSKPAAAGTATTTGAAAITENAAAAPAATQPANHAATEQVVASDHPGQAHKAVPDEKAQALAPAAATDDTVHSDAAFANADGVRPASAAPLIDESQPRTASGQRDVEPALANSLPIADPANAAQPTPPTTPVAAPISAPPATALPPADSPAPAAETRNLNSIAAAGPQRTRIPGEVLAPTPRSATRATAVAIDTVRLLSRVARAFAAAEERGGEVHLRLSPPELGSLKLEVRVQDGALVAHLHAETDTARSAILDNLPALRERLADQGVRIERFDVDLMQRQPGGSPDQPGGRQQEAPAAAARAASPPKTRLDTAAASSTLPAAVMANAAGLNVVV